MRYRHSITITKRNIWRLCIIYGCAVFYTVFLTPNRYSANQGRVINVVPVVDTIKRFYGQGNQHFWDYYIGYWGNIFGNIVLFMPFGFLLSYLCSQKRWQRILLYRLFTSIGIELAQLVFCIGVCDIDDVILNVTGAATGIIIYKNFGCNNVKERASKRE